MTKELARRWLLAACVIGALSGCASGPPSHAASPPGDTSSNDEYYGWLFKSLTGRRHDSAAAESKPTAPASTSSDVVPASASAPVESSGAVGPLVAGPSSHPGIAGPPPSIPAELPAPPAGAVSVASLPGGEAPPEKGFDLADLAPDKVWQNMKKAAGYGPDEKIARAAMQEGKSLFDAKKYEEAAKKFAEAAERWPDSPLEEDALFLQSESEFFADRYPKAHDTIGGLLKKYPNTRHLDTVVARQFAIGRYWEQLYTKNPTWPIVPNVTEKSRPLFDAFGYAVQAYERVRTYDPRGPLADDSLLALGNAYFLRGRWGDAAEQYSLLCKEYPNSEHQLKAHLFGLQANLRRYQGSAYDISPLIDADNFAKTTLTQYRGKLGEEEQRVARAAALIREEMANRDFVRAEYYAQHSYYGAARLYFQSVVDHYPNTEKAKEAKRRLEEIRDKPDEPPDHFRWLKNILDGKKKS